MESPSDLELISARVEESDPTLTYPELTVLVRERLLPNFGFWRAVLGAFIKELAQLKEDEGIDTKNLKAFFESGLYPSLLVAENRLVDDLKLLEGGDGIQMNRAREFLRTLPIDIEVLRRGVMAPGRINIIPIVKNLRDGMSTLSRLGLINSSEAPVVSSDITEKRVF